MKKKNNVIAGSLTIGIVTLLVAFAGCDGKEDGAPPDGELWEPVLVTKEKVEWFDPVGPDTTKYWEIHNFGSRDVYQWKLSSGSYISRGARYSDRIDMPSDYYFICYPVGSPIRGVYPTLTTVRQIDLTPYERGEAFLDFDTAGRGYGFLDVLISSESGETWDSDLEGIITYGPSGAATHYKADLSNYLGSTIKMRFLGARDYRGDFAVGIDNVYVRVFPE